MITLATAVLVVTLVQDDPPDKESAPLREKVEQLEKQLQKAKEQLEGLVPAELRIGRRLGELWRAAQSLGEKLESDGEKGAIEKAAKAASEAWSAMSEEDKKRSLQRCLDFYDALPLEMREDLFKRVGPEVFKRLMPPREKKKEKRDY